MRRGLLSLAALLLMILPAAAMGTVRFVKWDKPHGGSRANLAALDLSTRKVLCTLRSSRAAKHEWEAHPGKSINFVVEAKDGVMVGTDEGTLVLLNPSDGKLVFTLRSSPAAKHESTLRSTAAKHEWKTSLEKGLPSEASAKEGEINRFHSESEEGFLVSSGDERFWLVDHSGKLLMRCADQCQAK